MTDLPDGDAGNVPVRFRFVRQLVTDLDVYASSVGISRNAAAALLLRESIARHHRDAVDAARPAKTRNASEHAR